MGDLQERICALEVCGCWRSNLGHAVHHRSTPLTHPGCSMKDSEDHGQLLGDRKLLEQWKQEHETLCHSSIETENQTNWWPCISQDNTKPASQRFSTLAYCWRFLIGGFLPLATNFQLFTLLPRASKLLLVQLPARHQQPPGAVPRDHRTYKWIWQDCWERKGVTNET